MLFFSMLISPFSPYLTCLAYRVNRLNFGCPDPDKQSSCFGLQQSLCSWTDSIDMSWHVLTCIDMYRHVLTCIDMYWHVLTCIDISQIFSKTVLSRVTPSWSLAPSPPQAAAPSTTLPKTTCLPSKWGVGTVQMKNWLPFLATSGPEKWWFSREKKGSW